MSDIEPGDLIRAKDDGRLYVAVKAKEAGFDLIAKGSPDAPWTRHDGSSVNPVPGAEVAAYGRSGVEGILQYNGENPRPSENVSWKYAEFYRVTREAAAPVEAPAAPLHIHMPGPDPERPTLRDQFAMAALTGLLASHLQQLTHTTAALNAWAIADAMMKERSREP